MRVVIYHKAGFINDSFNYSSLDILASKLTRPRETLPETFSFLLPLPLPLLPNCLLTCVNDTAIREGGGGLTTPRLLVKLMTPNNTIGASATSRHLVIPRYN